MVAADVVPIVDMSLPEAEAARVLKVAAVTSGFFYGETFFKHPIALPHEHPRGSPCTPPPPLLARPFLPTHASAAPMARRVMRPRAVSQHGLDDLVQRQFAAARAFFELPTERKMEIMVDKYHRFVAVSHAPPVLAVQPIRRHSQQTAEWQLLSAVLKSTGASCSSAAAPHARARDDESRDMASAPILVAHPSRSHAVV